MMQFNLLPDVKLEFIKAQRIKRLVISASTIVTAVAVAIMVVLLALVFWQKKSLSDLNKDVTKYSSQVTGTQNLNKILTIQNQLNSLPGIDSKKPDTTKLAGYIAQLTPTNISYTDLSMDFVKNTITFSGAAPDFRSMDQFVDTIKFAQYSDGNKQGTEFSDVVLTNFSLNAHPQNHNTAATFTVNANFNPIIFNSTQNATLQVKSQITTRSEQGLPTNLFTGKGASTQPQQ